MLTRLNFHYNAYFSCILILLVTFIFGGMISEPAFSQSSSGARVYQIDIREEISQGMARKFSAAMGEAEALRPDLIVLNLNTYGGLLDAADSIRTRILNSPIKVVAYIDNNAASAGALISIACNKIYMRSGSSFGAATVVNMDAEALPDKYQSYMRSMMRSTAEKRGRNPIIAEAMVDPRTYIPGVNDSGKVLTFTTSEAIRNGYCDGEAENINVVLKAELQKEYTISRYIPSFLENCIGFLTNPAVSGILLLIMLGGIYFEFQAPGIGFPLFAAIIAGILYFAPLYIDGLAANWEILIALIGVGLIALEIFVIPGFGITGISGIILLVMGFTFSMIGNNGFDFHNVNQDAIARSLAIVVMAMVLSVIVSYIVGKRLLKTNRFNRMVLKGTMNSSEGFVSSDMDQQDIIGVIAITQSALRPSGKVMVGDRVYNAKAETGFIDAASQVVITRFDGFTMWVKEVSKSDE